MNLSLTPTLEQFIHDKVASGEYNNANEVVCEAIRLLKGKGEQHQLRIAQLKEALKSGITHADSGTFVDYSLDTFLQEMGSQSH